MNSRQLAYFTAVAILVSSIGAPALAQETDGESTLEEGLWLRAEIGWAANTLHREHDTMAIDQSLTADSPSAGLRFGYAPAKWVGIGLVGDFASTTSTFESSGAKTETTITTALTGVGARFHPFQTDFSFGVAGGWAFAYLDDSTTSSLMMGPGFSASIGFDQRIYLDLSSDESGQLFGSVLRLDVAPVVSEDNFTGHAYSLTFALAASS